MSWQSVLYSVHCVMNMSSAGGVYNGTLYQQILKEWVHAYDVGRGCWPNCVECGPKQTCTQPCTSNSCICCGSNGSPPEASPDVNQWLPVASYSISFLVFSTLIVIQ